MKLAFSFSKSAPPRKELRVQDISDKNVIAHRVEGVSQAAGIKTTTISYDVDTEMVIPCNTLYSKRTSMSLSDPAVPEEKVHLTEISTGLMKGHKRNSASLVNEVCQPPRKKTTSILMQIREARERGEIVDAPDQERRELDPEKYGWALLRGMGYDPSKDESPDPTKTVIGNRAKLGIGVRLESLALPDEPQQSAVRELHS